MSGNDGPEALVILAGVERLQNIGYKLNDVP